MDCDNSLIALGLGRRPPAPTLFRSGGAGITADAGFGLGMGLNDQAPPDLMQDREFITYGVGIGQFPRAGYCYERAA